jgi:DUF2075 family protein
MNKLSFELSIEISEQYDFNKESLYKIEQNTWVKNQWPIVYFIQNEKDKFAYVGESTNAGLRIKNHLANPKKSTVFNKISIIGSDKFNKSATLDIESKLIQYITSEGTYKLQNGNDGLINHNYYQQDLYKDLFKEIWNKLQKNKIVTKSLEEIENSELFKYSPYKCLNKDQYNSVIEILQNLNTLESNCIFIKGSAGTGKTILATYLIKLLNSDKNESDIDELNIENSNEIRLILNFQKKYPKKRIGLVIAMTSLRLSLENVFKKIPGLKASMILSPSDTFKIKEKYDLLIVDEAHRLRQYKNISWMGAFRQNNLKLGLDDSGTELDWILANSKNQIFFYDAAQSVKPSDVNKTQFDKLLNNKSTITLELKSQMRVKGEDSNNYINFVDELLNNEIKNNKIFEPKDYDLLIFDSINDFNNELNLKEEKYKLCRLIAGYSWFWESDPKRKPATPNAIDIKINDLEFQWNQTDKDWINNPKDPKNPLKEIGCIHTTQGYDLNYTGVIFGKEIIYNKTTNKIEIISTNYFDKNGKKSAEPEDLKAYIINIYKTIMYRGIKGTYIYACDENLRDYFKKYIKTFKRENQKLIIDDLKLRRLDIMDVKPYVNSVPLLDIKVAAGTFSDFQIITDFDWVELPMNISPREGYFVCQVIGESMNKIIPNGSWCLFKKDDGGSRNGKIVLVQSSDILDSDFGSGFTIKEYNSKKSTSEDSQNNQEITLLPKSNLDYDPIVLVDDDTVRYNVVGIFVQVLTVQD